MILLNLFTKPDTGALHKISVIQPHYCEGETAVNGPCLPGKITILSSHDHRDSFITWDLSHPHWWWWLRWRLCRRRQIWAINAYNLILSLCSGKPARFQIRLCRQKLYVEFYRVFYSNQRRQSEDYFNCWTKDIIRRHHVGSAVGSRDSLAGKNWKADKLKIFVCRYNWSKYCLSVCLSLSVSSKADL